jgi:hypothetical protein
MNAMTHALIDYWHRLPGTPASARCRALERACQHVRDGDVSPDALVPYALADSDEDVVYAAVSHYLDSTRPHDPRRSSPVDDALEWIRRHLALNRGAVFAAILGRGDPALNERLSPLRLTLSADDVATVARRAAGRPCAHSRQFLREWLELLSGEGAWPEREHLAAALGEGDVARAA